MKTKRDVLEMLGITSVAAVSTEAFAERYDDQDPVALARPSHEAQDRIAAALETLASQIRARTVSAVALDVRSKLAWNTWIEHTVEVTIEIH